MTNFCPVTPGVSVKLAIALATLAGSLIPSGYAPLSRSMVSGFDQIFSVGGVLVRPSATTLTRIFRAAISAAALRAMVSMAPLAAAMAKWFLTPTSVIRDDVSIT